jgi:hypothetical protein
MREVNKKQILAIKINKKHVHGQIDTRRKMGGLMIVSTWYSSGLTSANETHAHQTIPKKTSISLFEICSCGKTSKVRTAGMTAKRS